MGRVRSEITVNGKKCWTLFDSGARYSYILRGTAPGLDPKKLPFIRSMALGGKVHNVEEVCLVFAEIDGHKLEFQANILDDIGTDEDGRAIEVLFGAIAMQLWGIKLDLQNERLDLTHFAKDFVEYLTPGA